MAKPGKSSPTKQERPSTGDAALGSRIKAVRDGLEITQQKLADECRVSKGMISAIENGYTMPGVALLAQIGEKLNCGVDALLYSREQLAKLHRDRRISVPIEGRIEDLPEAIRELIVKTIGQAHKKPQ